MDLVARRVAAPAYPRLVEVEEDPGVTADRRSLCRRSEEAPVDGQGVVGGKLDEGGAREGLVLPRGAASRRWTRDERFAADLPGAGVDVPVADRAAREVIGEGDPLDDDIVVGDRLALAAPRPEGEAAAAVGGLHHLEGELAVPEDADLRSDDLDRPARRRLGVRGRRTGSHHEMAEGAAVAPGEVEPAVRGAVDPPEVVAAAGTPTGDLVEAEHDAGVPADASRRVRRDPADVEGDPVVLRQDVGRIACEALLLGTRRGPPDELSSGDVPLTVVHGPAVDGPVGPLEVVAESARRERRRHQKSRTQAHQKRLPDLEKPS